MLTRIVSTPRKILQALMASDSPSQLAAGFTLGMIIGLVPKGNLIAVSLCVLLFSLRVHKGLALVAAVAFSLMSPLIDSFSHKLGLIVLCADAFQTTYASVLSMPLGPWLGFNNTVVSGSLLVGLYVAYPVYWIVRSTASSLKSPTDAPALRTKP
jgi:uncharacterized protein (TIGR03546 family)